MSLALGFVWCILLGVAVTVVDLRAQVAAAAVIAAFRLRSLG